MTVLVHCRFGGYELLLPFKKKRGLCRYAEHVNDDVGVGRVVVAVNFLSV